jgi:hypothetical protein
MFKKMTVARTPLKYRAPGRESVITITAQGDTGETQPRIVEAEKAAHRVTSA